MPRIYTRWKHDNSMRAQSLLDRHPEDAAHTFWGPERWPDLLKDARAISGTAASCSPAAPIQTGFTFAGIHRSRQRVFFPHGLTQGRRMSCGRNPATAP